MMLISNAMTRIQTQLFTLSLEIFYFLDHNKFIWPPKKKYSHVIQHVLHAMDPHNQTALSVSVHQEEH